MPPRFTLIQGPEPAVTFIAAPILMVRRLADGSEMARFSATSHQLARKLAQRWQGRVEIVTGEPRQLPNCRPRTPEGRRS